MCIVASSPAPHHSKLELCNIALFVLLRPPLLRWHCCQYHAAVFAVVALALLGWRLCHCFSGIIPLSCWHLPNCNATCNIIVIHGIVIVLIIFVRGVVIVKSKLIVMCLPPSPFLCTLTAYCHTHHLSNHCLHHHYHRPRYPCCQSP